MGLHFTLQNPLLKAPVSINMVKYDENNAAKQIGRLGGGLAAVE